MRKKKDYDYIKELKEWQDHQYDPGYYLGGKISPYIKSPGNKKLLGLAFLIPVFMAMVFYAIISIAGVDYSFTFTGFEDYPWLGRFIGFFTSGIILVLMIVAGIMLLRRPKQDSPQRRKRRKNSRR